MRASARILGQALGLTAQELNYALKEAGFLSGEPGLYSVTDKGAKYAFEKYEKRGTGGYAQYNPSWETRSWDDSVLAELNLTDAKKRWIQQAASDLRRTRRAERSAATAAWAADDASRRAAAGAAQGAGGSMLTPAGWTLLAVVAASVAAYGIYKAAPLVQRVWKEKAAPGLKGLIDRVLAAGEDAGTDDRT